MPEKTTSDWYRSKTPYERSIIAIAKLNVLSNTKLCDLVKRYHKKK